ncbi:hypothetical protein SUGI_0281620 [Cryptomeria japonica]|nr:hypothetical protein SUGI_0281620 [Cryptomeria japonica]
MEHYWAFKEIGSTHSPVKKVEREAIKWNAPLKGWFKLNSDKASKGKRGESGFGAIIRNESGELLSGTYRYISTATNNKAKIHALEAGLQLCAQMGVSNVIIEGDSQIIINGIIKSNFQNWKLVKWFPHINTLLDSIGTCEINHSYCEGNCVANHLANLGVSKKGVIVTFNQTSVTQSIIDHIMKDMSDIPREAIG